MAATMSSGSVTSGSMFTLSGGILPVGTVGTNTLAGASVGQSSSVQFTWTYGTGSGQIDTLICFQNTLAASGTLNLNLFDGSLLDIFRDAGGLQNLKFVQIQILANPSTTTYASSLTIGDYGANANPLFFGNINDTQTIDKYVPFQQGRQAGVAVGAGSFGVKIVNNDAVNAATVQVTIGGVHT